MKRFSFLLLSLGALLLAGCGKNDSAAGASGQQVVELTAGDTMKYNLDRIEAKPGEEIKVILTNIGVTPKIAMAHNFVVLAKGTDVKAFTDAAAVSVATDYIPAALAGKVLAHTKVLGPKESDEITFKVPTEPGEYTFLCSFPAHYLAGMKGVLVVK